MKVILNASCRGVGKVGDIVDVRAGYARNYLIPKGIAIYATESNKIRFQEIRERLMAADKEMVDVAVDVMEKTKGSYGVVESKVGDGNRLFGSVTVRDVADAFSKHDNRITKEHIVMGAPIKNVGVYSVKIVMHSSVVFERYVVVARSESEADDLYEKFMGMRDNVAERMVDDIRRDADLELVQASNAEGDELLSSDLEEEEVAGGDDLRGADTSPASADDSGGNDA